MGRAARWTAVVAVVLACAAAPTAAAPPPNDHFGSAAPLLPPLAGDPFYPVAQGTNVEATGEPGEPHHHYGVVPGPGTALPLESVWYEWTAARTGPATIDTCGAPAVNLNRAYDTIVAVYLDGLLTSLAPVASSDDSPTCGARTVGSFLRFHAVAGTTYRIAVDGKGAATGEFWLRAQNKPDAERPDNDEFASARVLTGFPARDDATNVMATGEAGEPDHHPRNNRGYVSAHPLESVWWTWTAPASGPVEIDTCASPFDTILAVYTGSTLGSLVEVRKNDDAPAGDCGPAGLGSRVRFDASAGTTYRIAVDGRSGEMDEGPITLSIGPQSADRRPPNDDFADAAVLSGARADAAGTTRHATGEENEPDHAPREEDLNLSARPLASAWYSWTAPVDGEFELDTCTSDFDTVLAVYTGAALDDLSAVKKNDDRPGGGCGVNGTGSGIRLAANAGETYRIAVDGLGDKTGAFTLELAPVAPPAPGGCTIVGTSGNDVLRGTPGNDVICALAGDDIVYGRGGNDVIRLGAGNDVAYGGPGHDGIHGGPGRDRIVGGRGRDRLFGGPGRDRLDACDGVRGNDRLNGGAGRDRCLRDRGDVVRSCP